MRRWVLLVLIAIGSVAAAQQAAPSSQTTRDDVLRLFEAMQVRQQAEQMTQTVQEQMAAMMHAQMEKYAGTTPPEVKVLMDEMMKEAMAAYRVEEVIEDMVPAYQKHLDRRHLDAIVAFYESAAGKHLLSAMPDIMREAMPVAMARAQERMDPILERYQKRMIEILEKHADERPSVEEKPPAAKSPAKKPAAKAAPKKPAAPPQ